MRLLRLSDIHEPVRAEPVEALVPFDKLRANGSGSGQEDEVKGNA